MALTLPRGIRNNNPGNIRRSKIVWKGQADRQLDQSFVTFDKMTSGVRASAKIFLNYQRLYRLTTIEAMISRWAPPVENDTESYIERVSAEVGHARGEEYKLDEDRLIALLSAVYRHENGPVPRTHPLFPKWISDDDLKFGVRYAYAG